MHELLRTSHASGLEPWASLHLAGHGDHGSSVVRHVEEDLARWASAPGAVR